MVSVQASPPVAYAPRDEVRAVLERLEGAPRLMACLLYGAGLRLLECCRQRVQDVDLAANQIVVRAGKGDKDRLTMLPVAVKTDLVRHLELARQQHRRDLERGAGWVELPTALARKYPNAGREPPHPAALIRNALAQGRSRHPNARA
jgi:integrase